MSDQRKKKTPRCTEIEKAEKVAFASQCLVNFAHDAERTKAIVEKFGVAWRQAQRYLQEARADVVAKIKADPAEQLAKHVAFLESRIFNAAVKDRDRIQAQKQLAKLLGLRVQIDEKFQAKGRVELVLPKVRQIFEEMPGWQPPQLTVEPKAEGE